MISILIGEDHPANRELLTEILEGWGYSVHSASTGLGVLESLQTLMPGLVLLDIQMPGLDGYAVLEQIRKDERLRRLPVVALTAYAMRSDQERALHEGFDGYVAKPIDRNLLRDVIEKLTSEARRQAD